MRRLIYLLFYVLLPLTLGASSCSSAPERKRLFLAQHALDDFRDFRGLSMFIRGVNAQGNTLVVLADGRLDSASCSVATPLTFIEVSTADHRILTITHNFTGSCSARLAEGQIRKLTAKFLLYKVQNIRADSHGNVFVGFESGKMISTDLIRVASASQLDPYFEEDFKQKLGDWYERRQPES